MEEPPYRRQTKRPSAEDLQLWRHLTRGIKPLKPETPPPKAAPQTVTPPTLPAPPRERASPSRPSLRSSTAAGAVAPAKPAMPELSHGDLHAMDKRRAQRLRRGRLPIEARLDLHGLTQHDAHFALQRFVRQSAAVGRRCVLVITGKGGRHGESGVLRRQVPLWLNQADLRDKVLGFEHARPEHGGQGALYLLLRRPRAGRGEGRER